jgi:hypothetical protein
VKRCAVILVGLAWNDLFEAGSQRGQRLNSYLLGLSLGSGISAPSFVSVWTGMTATT